MFDLHSYLVALTAIVTLAVMTWLVSIAKRDVSIVDGLWSILFLAAAIAYATQSLTITPRACLILALVTAWALRLSIYITARGWGEPEDYRYQKIRASNQPNFAFKSLYIVFLLQGLLAWIISQPLLAAINSDESLNILDYAGAALAIFGVIFEATADWQLARFKHDTSNKGKVMDTGVWKYSRHPNYFGECCVWWGFYLLAVAAGGWWSILSPLLMTFLLLKVSGVAMLERTIVKRRPEYQRYIEQTNAFVPGPKRLRIP